MIPAAEFKKQISVVLGPKMRTNGFKGSGFAYRKETDSFLYIIGIQASNWESKCCVELGIHPKKITKLGTYEFDFKKLKYYQCEFRARLSGESRNDQWWEYSDDPSKNIQTAEEIFDLIVLKFLPIIGLYTDDPNIFSRIDVSEFDEFRANFFPHLGRFAILTTEARFAWALTVMHENKDFQKAKDFATLGLLILDGHTNFVGYNDFERVLNNPMPGHKP